MSPKSLQSYCKNSTRSGETLMPGRIMWGKRNRLSSNCYRLRRRRGAAWVMPRALQGAPGLPSLDYVGRLKGYTYGQGTSPLLFLAPMENLADRPFRRALAATAGGFDEACTEFIRIPGRSENPLGSIRGVASWYEAGELGELPLGAQIMGSNPELMGMAAQYLVKVRGAPRVDLNCGCPANTVTGNGAGSSLLRTPKLLGQVVAAMVQAVGGMAPVSVKLRAGFDDVSLMEDNLLAAQEAGAAFVTLHPRTRRQAYSGHADWGLIGRAVQRLDIPVVGNGDVVSVDRAHQLLRETGCHGLMVGRGAVHDPLIFLRIRHSFTADHGSPEVHAQRKTWQGREHEVVQDFLRAYAGHFIPELGVETPVSGAPGGHGTKPHVPPPRQTQQQQQQTQTQTQTQPTSMDGAICGGCGTPDSASPEEAAAARAFGRVKVVMRYLFASSPQLAAACEELLRRTPRDCSPADLVQELCTQVELGWPRSGGPTRRVLYDHMNKQVRQLVAA